MTPASPYAANLSALEQEAQRVMAQGLMKPSGRLWTLFDFLVKNAAQENAPTESVIALEVFGKSASDIGADDASVRVYMHRLRKKLSDHYLAHPTQNGNALTIPKGAYRLCLIETNIQTISRRHRISKLAALIAGFAALNLMAWGVWTGLTVKAPAVSHSIWAQFKTSDKPTMLVVGDYYIFQSETASGQLVRDFSINSPQDLSRARRRSPERYGQAVDLDLHYLPVSAAYAIAKISPHIHPAQGELNIMTASEVSVSTLKNYNIIYVGLLSGMSYLLNPVFENSNFSIGDNFDQIINFDSNETYTSSEIKNLSNKTSYTDYGYWSLIKGPSGNLIATLAATRDTGLRGLIDFSQGSDDLSFLNGSQSYEILIEVKGEDKENLTETLLHSRY